MARKRATLKLEGVTGKVPEVRHGETPEQPANQKAKIWLSWKPKNCGTL